MPSSYAAESLPVFDWGRYKAVDTALSARHLPLVSRARSSIIETTLREELGRGRVRAELKMVNYPPGHQQPQEDGFDRSVSSLRHKLRLLNRPWIRFLLVIVIPLAISALLIAFFDTPKNNLAGICGKDLVDFWLLCGVVWVISKVGAGKGR